MDNNNSLIQNHGHNRNKKTHRKEIVFIKNQTRGVEKIYYLNPNK